MKDASGNYVYQYALKDHLGNRRVTFVGNTTTLGTVAASDIKQVNHYYPFGMNMEGPAYSFSGPNKYQYNEKELNTDFGLNWNDYGARWYDASIGRWLAVDPLAEMYGNMSPYHYGMNNPIRFIDPTGMASEAANPGMMRTDERTNYEKAKDENDRILHGAAESDIAGSYTPYGTRTYHNGQQVGESVDGYNYTPSDGFFATYANGKVSYQRISGEGGNDYDVIYSGCIPCGTASSYRIDNTTGGTRTGVGTWMPSPATGSVDAVDDPFTYVDKSVFKIGTVGLKAMLGLFVIKKAVNTNLPHAIERAIERGIFANKSEASVALKQLTNSISKSGFPSGSILDPSKVDRVLVPIGNGGLAVYQVSKNGTAAIQTVLIAR